MSLVSVKECNLIDISVPQVKSELQQKFLSHTYKLRSLIPQLWPVVMNGRNRTQVRETFVWSGPAQLHYITVPLKCLPFQTYHPFSLLKTLHDPYTDNYYIIFSYEVFDMSQCQTELEKDFKFICETLHHLYF